MRIMNSEQINEFCWSVTQAGHVATAIKGDPPVGMKYSDGETVYNPVNIGWECKETGESIDVIYGPDMDGKGGK